MSLQDDPRLTAYALGELDEPERSAVERELEHDPAARQAVAEIRAVAEGLTREFAAEPLPAPAPVAGVRPTALAAAKRGARTMQPKRLRGWFWMSGLAAAAATIVLGLTWLGPRLNQARNDNVVIVTPPVEPLAARPGPEAPGQESAATQPPSGQAAAVPASAPALPALAVKDAPADYDRFAKRVREQGAAGAPAAPAAAGPQPAMRPGQSDDSRRSEPAGRAGGDKKKDIESLAAGRTPLATPAPPPASVSPSVPPPTMSPVRPSPAPGNAAGSAGKPNAPAAPPARLSPALRETEAAAEVVRGERRKLDAAENKALGGIDGNTEAYDQVKPNPWLAVAENPLSTFSIDVDTASYANVRRFLRQGQLPPPGAIRIEEMVNYFDYSYPQPKDERPFSITGDLAGCPWAPSHKLVRIGLKGKVLSAGQRPACNLVFLLDVSGSMSDANKLPLVKESMKLLAQQLQERDRVAIAVYAGASGLVLPPTSGTNRQAIVGAVERLSAGGSTNGAQGLALAYRTARESFLKEGANRVILCTDGDFNVGVTNQGELVSLVEQEAKQGTALTVLGFGMGNVKDSTLEKLADKGNGNYGYIDTLNEARKMLVEQLSGTLVTIAKDVKIQVEFNPAKVAAYRLVGYENRLLAKEDFNDDTKDAGEIGAGHTVTALYEIVPAGAKLVLPGVDPLKYQRPTTLAAAAAGGELLTVKLRYKAPDADKSQLTEQPLADADVKLSAANGDLRFACAVAVFGMILRGDPDCGTYNLDAVAELAEGAKGDDPYGYRAEFVELVKQARQLKQAEHKKSYD